MISETITANTLEEYYDKLHILQSGAHGKDYMLVHDEIKKHLKSCSSYTEFGINQGATLAAAVLETPLKVRAYDIKFGWYNDAHALFLKYTSAKNIDYRAIEVDTLKCDIDTVDLLYIDTLHQYEHLKKELSIHGAKVKKYIIFHDTFAQKGLKKAVQEYVKQNKEWKIITECDINVGFMTIEREQ